VKRFPYRVVYVVVEDAIDVIAVAHIYHFSKHTNRQMGTATATLLTRRNLSI